MVMTYSRRDRPCLKVTLDPTVPSHSDVIAVNISDICSDPVRVFNLYNRCRGHERQGAAAEQVLTHSNFDRPELYIGDFNMHHESWSLSIPASVTRHTAAWVARCAEHRCELAGPFGEA